MTADNRLVIRIILEGDGIHRSWTFTLLAQLMTSSTCIHSTEVNNRGAVLEILHAGPKVNRSRGIICDANISNAADGN